MKIRLELCPDDSVVIGGTLVITLEKKSGRRARFRITAPGDPSTVKMEGSPPEEEPVSARPLGGLKQA